MVSKRWEKVQVSSCQARIDNWIVRESRRTATIAAERQYKEWYADEQIATEEWRRWYSPQAVYPGHAGKKLPLAGRGSKTIQLMTVYLRLCHK
jgi:hypothetical protein